MEYAYTAADALPASAVRTETGVYDTVWKDKFLSWNGINMTYDAISNILTKGNTSYTWTLGRKLSGVNNSKSIQYYYNHNGARTKKVVDGVATEYRMAGDLLVSEKTGTQTYWYRYDSEANLVSVTIKGKIYFYVRNAQNDVIALVDAAGNVVIKYMYDSWGKVVSITGSLADTIGVQNPFRYRGYYYDDETGMYYLRNRYYDPGLKRFICGDEISTVKASMETLHNRNLYAYCNENPIMRTDTNGDIWGTIASALISGAISKTKLLRNGVKVALNMVLEGANSIIHKDSVVVGAVKVFTCGISEYIDVEAGTFVKKYKNYNKNFDNLTRKNISIDIKKAI